MLLLLAEMERKGKIKELAVMGVLELVSAVGLEVV